MKRSEVRAFIESGVTALGTNIPFGSGKITDFNSKRDNTYPTVWLETIEVDPELTDTGLPIDDWLINLHICQKDLLDSLPLQYEGIIDQCDEIAQKLIYKYNRVVEGTDLITISGYSRTPFIKKHADDLTGVLLSFTITAPDKTDAGCS
jgi:hypothetical protein